MHNLAPNPVKPAFAKTLALLTACFALSQWSTSSAWAAETEVTPIKRIALKENIAADETMRVMLYSNEFSLYPRLSSGPVYLPYQAPPGVSGSQAALGAIIGMMFVNRMNASERDEALKFKSQIDEALTHLDIKSELEHALAAELQKDGNRHLEFEHVTRGHELAQPGLLTRISEKDILTLVTGVSFDGELRAICIRSSAKLWRKDQARPLYYSEISYLSPSLSETALHDLRARWGNDNGELLRSHILEGIAEVAHMLALDLKVPPGAAASPAAANLEIVSPLTGKKVKTDFYAVEEKPGRLIGRPGSLDSSLLMSIPGNQQEKAALY